MQWLLGQQRLLSLLQLLYCNYNRNKNNIINWMSWPWPSKLSKQQKLYLSVQTVLDYVPSEAQPLMLCNGNMKCCRFFAYTHKENETTSRVSWHHKCLDCSVCLSLSFSFMIFVEVGSCNQMGIAKYCFQHPLANVVSATQSTNCSFASMFLRTLHDSRARDPVW